MFPLIRQQSRRRGWTGLHSPHWPLPFVDLCRAKAVSTAKESSGRCTCWAGRAAQWRVHGYAWYILPSPFWSTLPPMLLLRCGLVTPQHLIS